MAAVRTKLRRLLEQNFPSARIKLDSSAAAGRVGGTIVWEGFVGLDQVDRQRRVRDAVRAELDVEEHPSVGALLTLTPSEIAIMRAG